MLFLIQVLFADIRMKKIFILVIFMVVVGLGSFWLYTNKTGVVSKQKGDLENVRLKLNWIHETEFAGNYMGIKKGFYENGGLKVKIEEYSPDGLTAIDSVVAGKADFAIAGADEVIKARVEGKPVKAVAVIYKTNPAVAFALKSSGISKPTDFIGKKVGLERGINVDNLYAAMMNKLGIDRKKIKEVDVGYDAKELMNGTVDVSTGWITNEPNLVEEAGYPVNTILMADYGVNMYADMIVTSDKMILEKSQIVESFVRGTIDGWQYAIEHESEAVDVAMTYVTNGTSRSHQANILSSSIPLIVTGNTRLGWMELSKWEQAQNILFEQKIISKKIVIADAFSMQFVEAVYK